MRVEQPLIPLKAVQDLMENYARVDRPKRNKLNPSKNEAEVRTPLEISINHVDYGYPNLYSFDKRLDFAYLDSQLQSIEINVEKTVALPKLCCFEFYGRDRFVLNDNNAILIMYRHWMQKFITYIEENTSEEKKIFALTGPTGIGKSYCLYLLCAKLRKEGNRVLYIPSCLNLANSFSIRAKLVTELHLAFPEASEFIKMFEVKTINHMELFFHLKRFYQCIFASEQKPKTIYLIIDQLNSIYKNRHQQDTEDLLQFLHAEIPTVVSFSAISNIEKSDNIYTIYVAFDFDIDISEAKSLLATMTNLEWTNLQIKNIVDITGGNPLDIANFVRKYVGFYNANVQKIPHLSSFPSLCFNYAVKSFNEQYMTYGKEFAKYFDESPHHTQVKIVSEMTQILMLNGEATSTTFIYYDRKVIQKVTDWHGVYRFKIINSAAWNGAWEFLKSLNKEELDECARMIFGSSLNESAKRYTAVYYIMMKSIQKRYLRIGSLNVNIKIRAFYKFSSFTNELFDLETYNEETGSLFLIPEDRTFPAEDFFVYVPAEESKDAKAKILAIQLSIKENESSPYNEMLNYLREPSSKFCIYLHQLAQCFNDLPEFIQIYITKDGALGACHQENNTYYGTTFAEMAKDYPALSVYQ